MTVAQREEVSEFVLQHFARLAIGATGADIERAVRAARGAARREQRSMVVADLEAALKAGQPQLSGPFRRRIAAHEAGHAVVAVILDLGDVISVTIDGVHGGTTVVRPNPNRDQDEQWLSDQLVFTMAGRAAEMEIIGSVGGGSGAGAASDLEHATHIAADMEGRLGFGAVNPLLYLGGDAIRIRLLQDREFAARVHSRIEAAEARAVTLVRECRSEVELMADRLVMSGTLEKTEIPRRR